MVQRPLYRRLLSSAWGPVATGVAVGILSPLLVRWGNPGNMGLGVACFTRDIAGALGLHRVALGQYIRPEISGMVLGALVAALLHREFRPRGGSAALLRFALGALAMVGALVFLGCPWRASLRLAGGDWNAAEGLLGLVGGVGLGVVFLRRGFSLGASRPAPRALGWVMPLAMVGLLLLLLLAPQFRRDSTGQPSGPIFFSSDGPGSQHAPPWVALGCGLVVGFLAQRSRFCIMAAVRNVLLVRDAQMLRGLVALIAAAFGTNLLLGQFHPGFEGQPIAHTEVLWNVGGMLLVGLASTLAGGCPARQLFLSGEGDTDAGVFVLGMFVGAALAHNMNVASCPTTVSPYGPAAITGGLVLCVVIGLTVREPGEL
jgi:uncharacterized protein